MRERKTGSNFNLTLKANRNAISSSIAWGNFLLLLSKNIPYWPCCNLVQSCCRQLPITKQGLSVMDKGDKMAQVDWHFWGWKKCRWAKLSLQRLCSSNSKWVFSMEKQSPSLRQSCSAVNMNIRASDTVLCSSDTALSLLLSPRLS